MDVVKSVDDMFQVFVFGVRNLEEYLTDYSEYLLRRAFQLEDLRRRRWRTWRDRGRVLSLPRTNRTRPNGTEVASEK